MFDEILKNAPFLREVIEKKIEDEKAPLQAEVTALTGVVEDLTAAILMGGL